MHPATRHLITCTGPDQPGLVAAITRVLAEGCADLEDVSMTRLSGNFAILLLARGGEAEQLLADLRSAVEPLGLRVHIEPAVEQGLEPQANCYISASGPNRIGIVAALSQELARHKVNILEMTTRLLDRTEVPVYLVRIEALADLSTLEQISADLDAAAAATGVEVRLESIESEEF